MSNEMPSYSDLPSMVKSGPLGLLIAFIFFAIILIFNSTLRCAFKSGCNPDTTFGVKFGTWLIGLLNHSAVIWILIIGGVLAYIYFKNKK